MVWLTFLYPSLQDTHNPNLLLSSLHFKHFSLFSSLQSEGIVLGIVVIMVVGIFGGIVVVIVVGIVVGIFGGIVVVIVVGIVVGIFLRQLYGIFSFSE